MPIVDLQVTEEPETHWLASDEVNPSLPCDERPKPPRSTAKMVMDVRPVLGEFGGDATDTLGKS